MSDRDLARGALAHRPPRRALYCLSALLCLPALYAYAGGAGVGGYRMFTRPTRYRLTVYLERDAGHLAPVPLATLARHLGRDARQVLLSAERGAAGETKVALLARGLPDIARLTCALHPDAYGARVVLHHRDLTRPQRPPSRLAHSQRCRADRAANP